ncbi:hypothetical protein PROFUN_16109, partial [Planoprotostelium fungivorum]
MRRLITEGAKSGSFGKWQINFMGKQICSVAICRSLAVGLYTFKQARRFMAPAPHGNIGKSKLKETTENAIQWLTNTFALISEIQPNCDEIHLPLCLDKTTVYHDLLHTLDITNQSQLPSSTFYYILQKHFGNYKWCRKTTLGRSYQRHLEIFKNQRAESAIRKMQSMHSATITHISIDGMRTPLIPEIRPTIKGFSGVERLKLKIFGLIDHGRSKKVLYCWPDIWPGGPNTTCSIVVEHITWLKQNGAINSNSVLEILLDNTSKENKCSTVIAFAGHTHWDVDQMFAAVASKINRSGLLSPLNWDQWVQEAWNRKNEAHPGGIRFYDFAKCYSPVVTQWEGISRARAFEVKIFGEGDQARAGFLYKEYITDSNWLGWQDLVHDSHTPARPIFIFQNNATWDAPQVLPHMSLDPQMYKSLRDESTLDSLANRKHQQWWLNFFKDPVFDTACPEPAPFVSVVRPQQFDQNTTSSLIEGALVSLLADREVYGTELAVARVLRKDSRTEFTVRVYEYTASNQATDINNNRGRYSESEHTMKGMLLRLTLLIHAVHINSMVYDKVTLTNARQITVKNLKNIEKHHLKEGRTVLPLQRGWLEANVLPPSSQEVRDEEILSASIHQHHTDLFHQMMFSEDLEDLDDIELQRYRSSYTTRPWTDMRSSMLRLLFLFACILLAHAAVDLKQKKTIWGDLAHLKIPSVSPTPPTYKYLPQTDKSICEASEACSSKSGAANNGFPVDSVYKVLYADGISVFFCLCQKHGMNLTVLADRFAYVPVSIRSAVRKVTSKPSQRDGGKGVAYAVSGSVTLMGDWPSNTIVHESGHCFDAAYGITSSPAWDNALQKDTCVTNRYAQSSYAESFAESCIVWTFFARNNSKEDVYTKGQLSCWNNQRLIAKASLPYLYNPAPFNPSTLYYITSKSNRSLGVNGLNIATDPKLTRRWHIVTGGYDYVLICDEVDKICIDASGRKKAGESPVWYKNERNGKTNQQWSFISVGQGYYKIVSRANQLVLEDSACANKAVQGVQFATDSGSDCQKSTNRFLHPQRENLIDEEWSDQSTDFVTNGDRTRTSTKSPLSREIFDRNSSQVQYDLKQKKTIWGDLAHLKIP